MDIELQEEISAEARRTGISWAMAWHVVVSRWIRDGKIIPLSAEAAGHWVTLQDGRHVFIQEGAYGGHSAGLKSALKDAEQKIRNSRTEIAVAFDATGTWILEKTSGMPNEVTFTPNECAQLRNTVYTHNHPLSRSFSDADRLFACETNLQEIRATCADGTIYRIVRGEEGWPTVEQMFDARDSAYSRVMDKASKMGLSLVELNNEGWHMENEEIAEIFRGHLRYERIRPNA